MNTKEKSQTVQEYLFCMTKNVRGGKAIPSTQQQINEARESQEVVNAAKRVGEITMALGNKELSEADRNALEAEKKQVKISVPAVCYHAAQYKNDSRSNDGATPSGFAFFDADHVSNETFEACKEKIMKSKDLWGIILFEKSISGDGFHVVFKIPKGMSIKQAQMWMSGKLGVECDKGIDDLARCCFLTPKENVIWQDEWKKDEMMVEDAVIVKEVKQADAKAAEPKAAEAKAEKAAEANAGTGAAAAEPKTALADDGAEAGTGAIATGAAARLAYAREVFDLCVAEAGLSKDELDIEGVHNWHNNLKAVLSVGVCNLVDEVTLMLVLAEKMQNYIATDDCKRLVSDFYRNYSDRNGRMSLTLRRIHSEAQKAVDKKAADKEKERGKKEKTFFDVFNSPEAPALPKHLPALLQHVVKPIPELYHEAVASACFAPLQAYMSGKVKYKYIDNTEDMKNVISICIAPASIGKSSIDKVKDRIIARIEATDAISRKKDSDYRKKAKRRAANEKAPERPEDICVQHIQCDFTNAALTQRLADADNNGQKRLYFDMPEIEGLNRVKKTGGGDVMEFLRNLYDGAMHGQERVGADSVCEKAPLNLSTNISTTPSVARRYFNGKPLTDGTVTRLDTTTIILPEGADRKIPIYGDLGEEYLSGFDFYIDNLMAADGVIVIPELIKLAESINKDLAAYRHLLTGADLRIYDAYYPRALAVAFVKGVLLYVSAGNVWTKEMANFVRWQVYYNLWVKFHYFYDLMLQAFGDDRVVGMHRGPKNMLSMLPDTFSRKDYLEMRALMGKTDDGGQQLNTWKARKYIELDSETGLYSKTKKYTMKFGVA